MIHDADRKGWSLWFRSQRLDDIAVPRGPSFDDTALLRNAVLSGQGVGLLPSALVESEIAAERLVGLFAPAIVDNFSYYLVCIRERQDEGKIVRFRQWMAAQTDASQYRLALADVTTVAMSP